MQNSLADLPGLPLDHERPWAGVMVPLWVRSSTALGRPRLRRLNNSSGERPVRVDKSSSTSGPRAWASWRSLISVFELGGTQDSATSPCPFSWNCFNSSPRPVPRIPPAALPPRRPPRPKPLCQAAKQPSEAAGRLAVRAFRLRNFRVTQHFRNLAPVLISGNSQNTHKGFHGSTYHIGFLRSHP